MIKYVLGFAFNPDLTQVIMLRKTHPDWQIGKFNGVGGKINEDETMVLAMVREFKEEVGIETRMVQWKEFGTMSDGHTWICYLFTAILTLDEFGRCAPQEDESLIFFKLEDDPDCGDLLPNCRWLIPLAKDKHLDPTLRSISIGYNTTKTAGSPREEG